jgi:hypothetical protein
MEQTHKVLFILVGLGIIGLLLGWRCYPGVAPALIAHPSADPDDMVLGDSTPPATDNVAGPSYLTANVQLFFPPPLAHLNPTTSDELSG